MRTFWLLASGQPPPSADSAVVVVNPIAVPSVKPRRDSVAVYVSESERSQAGRQTPRSKGLLSRLGLKADRPANIVFDALRTDYHEAKHRAQHQQPFVCTRSSSDDRIASAPPAPGSPTQSLGRRRRRSRKSGRVSPRAVTVQPHPSSPDYGRHDDVYSIKPPSASSVEASPVKRRVSWAPMQGSRDSLHVPACRPNRESVDTMPAASDSGWGRQGSQDPDDSTSSHYTSPAISRRPSHSASQSRSSSMVPSRPGSSMSIRVHPGSSISILSAPQPNGSPDSEYDSDQGELGATRGHSRRA